MVLRWLPAVAALLLLLTAAEGGRWRQGTASWQPGRARVAVRPGVAKKGDLLLIAGKRGQIRRRVCCLVRLPKGRSLDLDRRGFRSLGELPSRGTVHVRWRIERKARR